MKYYTGVGSRNTPRNILSLMSKIARQLNKDGWTLRSGGAAGADTAFEYNTADSAEIFLPWKGFNGHPSALHHISPKAYEIAEKFHPAWERLRLSVRKLHARNVHQVLGVGLDSPSKFLICWTADGKASGGTGQAIRIAEHYGIPVFNLYFESVQLRLKKYIGAEPE